MDGTTRPTNNDITQDTHMDIATDKTTTPMIAQGILDGTVVDTAKVMPPVRHNSSRHKRINRTNSNSSNNNPNPRHLVHSSSNPTIIINYLPSNSNNNTSGQAQGPGNQN